MLLAIGSVCIGVILFWFILKPLIKKAYDLSSQQVTTVYMINHRQVLIESFAYRLLIQQGIPYLYDSVPLDMCRLTQSYGSGLHLFTHHQVCLPSFEHIKLLFMHQSKHRLLFEFESDMLQFINKLSDLGWIEFSNR